METNNQPEEFKKKPNESSSNQGAQNDQNASNDQSAQGDQQTNQDQNAQTPPVPPTADPAPGSDQKTMAIIAYIVFFVPLLTDQKNDPFVKFHVKQSLLLFLAWIAVSVFMVIPIIGWIAGPIAYMGLVVLWVMGLINAINMKKKPIPLIGKLAEQWFKF
jgi:uncharacterized membrane protein